jgi:hypothetical protein
MGGWDELKSKDATVVGAPISLANKYLKAKGISGDLVAWFHLNAGKPVAPYVYFGAGVFSYKRTVPDEVGWPEAKDYMSIHVPVGIGIRTRQSAHFH